MSNTNYEFDHAIGAVLDYGFNWTAKNWLATGETITTSTWTAPVGVTLTDSQNSAGITSVFVSGLFAGVVYEITNKIVTSLGRTDVRTIILSCKQR